MSRFQLLVTAVMMIQFGSSAALAGDGKTYLLCVSVSEFPKMPKYRSLENADAAVKKLQEALIKSTPADKRVVSFLSVQGGASHRPTINNIRLALNRFSQQVQAQDRVIVVFLTHGFENRNGPALITYDSAFDDPNSILSVRELVGRVKAMRCKQACVFLDACRDFRDDIEIVEQNDYLDPADAARRKYGLLKPCATYLLQSCSAGEYAFERPNGTGLMTECLYEVLTSNVADQDSDGNVTIREALDFTCKSVRDDARHYHRASQNPSCEILETSGDPIVLARVANSPPRNGSLSSRNPQKPPYRSAELPLGAPSSPSSTPRYNAGIASKPASQVLAGVRQLPIPPEARKYIPQPGAPLAGQIRRWIR